MPKSTATMRPPRVDEQVALVHVGVEEAVAHARGAGRFGLHQRAGEQGPVMAAPCRMLGDVRQAWMPSIHSRVSTPLAVRSQSIDGHVRKSMVGRETFSFEFGARRRGFQAKIHLQAQRSGPGSRPRRRAWSRRICGTRRSAIRASRTTFMSGEVAARKLSLHARPACTFTATSRVTVRVDARGRLCTCATDAAAIGSPKLDEQRCRAWRRKGAPRSASTAGWRPKGAIRSWSRAELRGPPFGPHNVRDASPGTGRASRS